MNLFYFGQSTIIFEEKSVQVSNNVEIQANQKTSKWVERLAKKKPSVLIYQLKTDEVGEHYGW